MPINTVQCGQKARPFFLIAVLIIRLSIQFGNGNSGSSHDHQWEQARRQPPCPVPRGEVILPVHPHDRGHTDEGIEHQGNERPFLQADEGRGVDALEQPFNRINSRY